MQVVLLGRQIAIQLYITYSPPTREGANALDAAFMAYSGISMLRQQMKPDERVHGVVEGKNWLPNGKILFFFFSAEGSYPFSYTGLRQDVMACSCTDLF